MRRTQEHTPGGECGFGLGREQGDAHSTQHILTHIFLNPPQFKCQGVSDGGELRSTSLEVGGSFVEMNVPGLGRVGAQGVTRNPNVIGPIQRPNEAPPGVLIGVDNVPSLVGVQRGLLEANQGTSHRGASGKIDPNRVETFFNVISVKNHAFW